MVGLYAATKDRWKWRRIAKWLFGVPVALIVIGGLGLWGYSIYQDRPTPQTEFGSIKLGESMAEVRFKKGEPSKKHGEDVWQYNSGTGDKLHESTYAVMFKDGNVRWVRYFGSKLYSPYLLGFSASSSYDDVIAKLGQPSYVSISKDGLTRMLSFDKYRVVFGFEQARVEVFGVYDPAHGPLRFSEEASGPTLPASSAAK